MTIASHPEVPTEPPLLVSVEDAARMLGIGRSSMWNLIRRGEIGTRRIRRRTLIRRQALENFAGARDRQMVSG